jgi:hypothetical protein
VIGETRAIGLIPAKAAEEVLAEEDVVGFVRIVLVLPDPFVLKLPLPEVAGCP